MDKYYLLVDIDGTLSDASERAKKYLGEDVPDWDGFYNACGEDVPIQRVIDIIEVLARAYDIVLCTGRRTSCDTKIYLKSEADKVIAELKDKALQYKVLDKEHYRDLNTQERFFAKQIAHQKYKRCLAMASKCRLRARWFGDNAFYKKEQWALQWHRRWLELAEKFKEEK